MSATNGTNDAVKRLLGVDAQEGIAGAAAMLGLPGPGVGPTAILNALNEKLGELLVHPEGTSADADKVRERLHAAASMMLQAEWTAPLADRVGPELPASELERIQRAHAELARDAVLTLSQFGGWNRSSMRRLILLAQRRGVDVTSVPGIVLDVARRNAPAGRTTSATSAAKKPGPTLPPMPSALGAGTALAGSGPRPGSSIFADDPSQATPDQIDPARKLVKVALLVVGGVLALLLAAGVVLTLLVNAPKAPPAAPTEPDPTVVVTPPASPPAKAIPRAPKASELAQAEPGAVLRALTTAVETLDLDAGVAEESFAQAVRGAAEAWPRLAPDQIAAMQESIVEFVYRSASAGNASQTAVEVCLENLADISAGKKVEAGKVIPTAFSAGVAARLLGEREMPALAAEALHRAIPRGGMVSLSAGPFATGAIAAANALAAQMGQHAPLREDAWKAWDVAVTAMTGADEQLSSRVRLLALDAVLAGPPDFAMDPALGRVTGLLVKNIQWRDGDESRRWLVRWLDSPKASSAGLSAVMTALIEESSAAKIDVTMRLAPAATVDQRADLRERLAKQWGVGDVADRGETYKAWVEALGRNLPVSDPSPLKRFAHAVILCRLSEAAGLLADGDATAAATVLGDLDGPVAKLLARQARTAPESPAPMDDWLTRYAAAEKNTTARIALLGEVRGDRLPPAVAETIMVEALRGSNYQVRDAAREIVKRRAGSVEIVNALLEQLPTMARTRDNAELVALAVTDRLPAPRDLGWRAAARRALVARLLDQLAVDPESEMTQGIAELLGESYAARVGSTAAAREGAASKPVADLAALLRREWRERAVAAASGGPQPALIGELDARDEARTSLARGLVQRFAASQVGAAEMMAAAVRAEHPSAATQIDQIMAEMAESRRRAAHAFEQIDACETAMARLWQIKLAGGAV